MRTVRELVQSGVSLVDAERELRAAMLKAVLELTEGSSTAAAQRLGISRNGVTRLVQECGLTEWLAVERARLSVSQWQKRQAKRLPERARRDEVTDRICGMEEFDRLRTEAVAALPPVRKVLVAGRWIPDPRQRRPEERVA